MNLFALGYMFSFLINTSFGVFILVRNTKSQANRVFFVLSMAVALMAFSQFEFVKAESVATALYWYRIGILWPVVLPLLLHFASIYPLSAGNRLPLTLGLVIYLPAIALIGVLLATPTADLATVIRVESFWVIEQVLTMSLAGVMIVVLSTLYTVVIVFVAVYHLARATDQLERRQRFLVFLGVVLGLGSSVLSYAVMPAIGVPTPDIATYGFGAGCVILGFAVWKYKLLTLDLGTAAEDIVRVMPDALMLIGEDNSVLRVNEAALRLLGESKYRLIGQSFPGLFGEGARTSVEGALVAPSAEPSPRLRTQIRTAIGEDTPVELSFSPVMDTGGNRVGTVCVGHDLRRQLQAEADRTSLEERLRQSEKMEAIGRLAGGVAHDFNNILAGILGYADLLKLGAGTGNDKLDEYVGNIVDSAKRAAGLVTNLLTFARKKQVILEPVDLHTVVRQVTDLVSHSIDKRISVEVSLQAASPLVLADASQMHNAILNLAINARDAIDGAGSIAISTTLEQLDRSEIERRNLDLEPRAYVILAVKDTGSGIARSELDQVFDPFFTTKEVGQGTGLGLASVYGAARGCGGTVHVSSEEGYGSTFTLYLPSAPSSGMAPNSEEVSIAGGTAGVLIIDDERFVREVTATALDRAGYTTHSFAESSEGIEFLKQNRDLVDLVILDLNMPGKSGYEVFEELQRMDHQLPVLISTGLLTDGDGAARLRERVAGFIQKPFNVAQLSSLVSQALGRPRS